MSTRLSFADMSQCHEASRNWHQSLVQMSRRLFNPAHFPKGAISCKATEGHCEDTHTAGVGTVPSREKLLERRRDGIFCTLGLEGLLEKDLQHELPPGVQEGGLLSRWIELPVLSEKLEHLPQSTKKTDIKIRAVKIYQGTCLVG